MTGPTHDVYYGGSRDGERWALDGAVTVPVVMSPAGDVYQRHPDMDGPEDRAWVLVPSIHPTAASGVHVEPQQGRKHLTLADLRNLVTTAERMGHQPDATVYGTVTWRGQLLRAGIKAEQG